MITRPDDRSLVPVGSALVEIPAEPAHLPVAAEIAAAAEYAKADKAESTRRAYRSDFDQFRAWCAERALSALPATPQTVAAFLAFDAARSRPATINRRASAIRYAHKLAGLPAPTEHEIVRATVRGIRRSLGIAPRKKTAATTDKIIAMAPLASEGMTALRDRALLLIGFAGALRRSELVAVDRNDIEEVPEGLRVTIRRSKTDQEAQGAVIGIPRGAIACPVAAISEWLSAAGIASGPVFRPIAKNGRIRDRRLTPHSVAAIIKRHAARIGLEPQDFAGHSLRSGFLTSAAARGAGLFRMADQSRHRSLEVLRGYIRSAEIFKNHPGEGLL